MIKMLSLTGTDNYQLIYRGQLEAQNIRLLRQTLEEIKDRDGNVRLVTRMDHIPTFKDVKSFWELLRMKRSALKVIKQYAILTPKTWIKQLVPLANWLTPGISVRAFEPEEAPRAIAWLNEDTQ
ncbi:MAG: STAS/SEC14 domain-containing protein [Bacteroidota bacterium]